MTPREEWLTVQTLRSCTCVRCLHEISATQICTDWRYLGRSLGQICQECRPILWVTADGQYGIGGVILPSVDVARSAP